MNRLINESSPYLRQHADNPVEWYPWGEEALTKAREEDKPIFVSIGYSPCHWCHVMERESFEDVEVAAFMNRHFINIKVDREERPDLDALYMDACQIIAGTSGWPLNVFLTPQLKPFFAGTYFPPQPGHKRMSWFQALQYVLYNFRQNRPAVEARADQVLARMKQMGEEPTPMPTTLPTDSGIFSIHFSKKMFDRLRQKADWEEGGFGHGQKFPNTMALEFLLNYHALYDEPRALQHLQFTLSKILRGGIYDQVGGGIARYTTDRHWRVPHFEKMLYDNALLLQLLAKAFQYTAKRKYLFALRETIAFLQREMQSPNGGFYAAIDADSEEKEGYYYLWNKTQIDNILGSRNASLFCDFFGITEKGNWEQTNILYQPYDLFTFADQKGIDRKTLRDRLNEARRQLLRARQNRQPPHRDEKIILGWNALLTSAYAHIYSTTGEDIYFKKANDLLSFLMEHFIRQNTQGLWRTLTNGKGRQPATLRDYAFLIRALLDVFQLSFDEKLLTNAAALTELVFKNFLEKNAVLFNYSTVGKSDILFGQKDVKDDEMPSGNAAMARNLQDLGILLGRTDWRQHAATMLTSMKPRIAVDPLGHAAWANALLAETEGILEIAIIGPKAIEWGRELRQIFVPFRVLAAKAHPSIPIDNMALLKDKPFEKQTLIYVCKDYACQQPLKKVEDFKKQYGKKAPNDPNTAPASVE
ncbi:MAG TPA: thioredoxin domain-containing protein [Bacteroidetes bacterium]|nr:thioredoxin domain-containing protein [Bacteroidota bacterium]